MQRFALIKDRTSASGALANNAYGDQNIFAPFVRILTGCLLSVCLQHPTLSVQTPIHVILALAL